MKLLLLAIVICFAGCQGTGFEGAWTPADTTSTLGAVDAATRTYRNVQDAYYYQPQQPVYPVYPSY